MILIQYLLCLCCLDYNLEYRQEIYFSIIESKWNTTIAHSQQHPQVHGFLFRVQKCQEDQDLRTRKRNGASSGGAIEEAGSLEKVQQVSRSGQENQRDCSPT